MNLSTRLAQSALARAANAAGERQACESLERNPSFLYPYLPGPSLHPQIGAYGPK